MEPVQDPANFGRVDPTQRVPRQRQHDSEQEGTPDPCGMGHDPRRNGVDAPMLAPGVPGHDRPPLAATCAIQASPDI